jgi:hypothetical protein
LQTHDLTRIIGIGTLSLIGHAWRVRKQRADRFQHRKRVATMKQMYCGLAALGLFLGITLQAKAEYLFTTIDVPGATSTESSARELMLKFIAEHAK